MQPRPENRDARSRPKDRSLEAYKVGITEIANRLTTDKTKLKMTEKEWVENCRTRVGILSQVLNWVLRKRHN